MNEDDVFILNPRWLYKYLMLLQVYTGVCSVCLVFTGPALPGPISNLR